ncbi:MAG TPA: 7-carboxy-7-deazaguanine synthase QueE [Chitinophagaceae bacterium]|nr:7-carboxy-7-deazaguanine synthase QueE [Chitinophagaceae bacterium]
MPVEEQEMSIGITYPLMEQFYTIQGEGYHQGRAAYFIRLAGCDVGCVWCDVKESWDKDKHPMTSIEDILQLVTATPARIVVITGGEPFMYDLDPLIRALHQQGLKVHIETSGAYAISGDPDWICVSPKKFKAPLDEVMPHAHELKVVIFNKSDFAWAEKYEAMVGPSCKLFLQPEWGKAEEMTPLIIDYIKQHPQWEFSLQMHKYIHVP